MMIDSIRTYMITCPYLDDERVINVDYLTNELSYSIEPIPSDPYVKRFVDGGGIKQFQFAFTSKESYDASETIGINQFYEQFSEWIELQNDLGIYPFEGCTGIEIMTSGYLFDSESANARYQIQLRVLYERQGN
jgi:hypothetical protein